MHVIYYIQFDSNLLHFRQTIWIILIITGKSISDLYEMYTFSFDYRFSRVFYHRSDAKQNGRRDLAQTLKVFMFTLYVL